MTGLPEAIVGGLAPFIAAVAIYLLGFSIIREIRR